MTNTIQYLSPPPYHFSGRWIKHIYSNHLEQVEIQLQRTPGKLPRMTINPAVKDIFSFRFEDFELQDYNPQAHISAPVAV